MNVDLADAAATDALGAAFATALADSAGMVIFLHGELGAGKTSLARAMLRQLGVTGTIRSPTYTLMELYRERGREMLHMDLYRLSNSAELHNLGLVDYPPERTLWLVEWPERGENLLPPADISIALTVAGEARKASVVRHSKAGQKLVEKLS